MTHRAHCVRITEPANENESGVYINSIRLEENGGQNIYTFRSQPESETPLEILQTSAVKYPNQKCFGEREQLPDGTFGDYKWLTYSEIVDLVDRFATGLLKQGIKEGDKIGIYSPNAIPWMLTFLACSRLKTVAVPVYDSLGPEAAKYIIMHSECTAVVVHPIEFEKLSKVLPETKIKLVITTTKTSNPQYPDWIPYVDLLKEKQEFTTKAARDDLLMVMYTSGSTGLPKGCELTNINPVAGGCGLASVNASINTNDVFFSFLPLAHIYELGVEMAMIGQGASIGFSTGDSRRIVSDAAALQPTIMCSVPRVLNRVYDTMNEKIEKLPTPLKFIIRGLISLKKSQIRVGKAHSLIGDMFLAKFREALGGKLRLVVSGGAPIKPNVYEFIQATITPNVIQGYGLSEISAAGCVQECGINNPSTVGPVSIAVDLKLRKVPEFNYDPNGETPTGEILFRGPTIFRGYYKEPEMTAAVLQDDWFATGDVGMVCPDGTVQIIDRVKQLVKLSQGEYVSVTNLTEIYNNADGVSQIFLYIDPHHNFPVACVVPTREWIEKWTKNNISKIEESDVAKKELMDSLNKCHQENSLRGFERICNILIETNEFTIDNGLLTPSLKQQLSSLKNKYESRLMELYND